MNAKQFSIILLAVVVISAFAVWTFVGLPIENTIFSKPLFNQMNLGLDIEGGVSVLYEIETQAQGEELKQIKEQTKAIISRRINSLGLTEPNVYFEGDKRIMLEIPGVSDAKEALKLVGTTAQLEFAQVKNNTFVVEGEPFNEEKMTIMFAGNAIKASNVTEDQFKLPAVGLELTSEGADIFAKTTAESAQFTVPGAQKRGGQIAIMLDRIVISAPIASEAISSGRAIISGNFTQKEAYNLSTLISGGALPANLNPIMTQEIGPTLGMQALNTSVQAGLIGILIVMAIMIFNYRLSGVVASLTLVLYATLTIAMMVVMNATLTLPGIAGMLLSVGMAVDANVIIFERVKEEYAQGKSLRASVEFGFSKTMLTIFDANITTLIAAIVLFEFGEGAIKGFAITLMLGIIISVITAIFITKTILLQFVYSKAFSNVNMYFKRKEA